MHTIVWLALRFVIAKPQPTYLWGAQPNASKELSYDSLDSWVVTASSYSAKLAKTAIQPRYSEAMMISSLALVSMCKAHRLSAAPVGRWAWELVHQMCGTVA